MKRNLLLITCCLGLSLPLFAKEVKIASPDGNYQMRVYDRVPDYRMQGPFRVISRDGEYRHTKDKMEADFHAVYQNALMWMITENGVHARKSLEILTAYADSLQMIPETNDASLLAAPEGFKMVYAMEMLKHTYCTAGANMQHTAALAKIEAMFRNVFLPVPENRDCNGNGNGTPIPDRLGRFLP